MIKQPKKRNAQKKKEKIKQTNIEDGVPGAPKHSDFEIIGQIESNFIKDDVEENSCPISDLSSQREDDMHTDGSRKLNRLESEWDTGLDPSGILQNKEKGTSGLESYESFHAKKSDTITSNTVDVCPPATTTETNVLQFDSLSKSDSVKNYPSEVCNYSALSSTLQVFSQALAEASAPTDERSIVNNKLTINIKNIECMDVYNYNFSIPIKDAVVSFTDEKLSEFYCNPELKDVKCSVNKKINEEITNPTKLNNYFYRLLLEYIQAKNNLYSYGEKIKESRKRLDVCTSAMWTIVEDISISGKMCNDDNKVSFVQKYLKAQFNANIHDEFAYLLKEIKCVTYENYLQESFISSFLRLKVEYYLQSLLTSCPEFSNVGTQPISISSKVSDSYFLECLQQLKQAINVLFNFQKKDNIDADKEFLEESRQWLSDLVSVLLRVGTWEDHIFVLNHVLRCPGGVSEWATAFIQLPCSSDSADPFNNDQINHIMTVLHIFLSPLDKNENLIKKPETNVPIDSNPWTVVDSDGEIEGDTNQKFFLLKENDLMSILNQIPFGYLFKEIFHYRDGEIGAQGRITSEYFFKLFSFSTDLIKILLNGLKSYSAKRYKQFNKRLGQLICHTVHYATEVLVKFQSSNQMSFGNEVTAKIQAEYDSFFLRSIKSIYSAKQHGPWQFLVTMPYHVVSANTVLKIYALLQLNETQNDSILTVNFASFEEKFLQLPEEEKYYLLTTFANMALSRDISEIAFIRNVIFQLFFIGFASSQTVDFSYKNVKYLLCSLCSSHPFFISEILCVQNQIFITNPNYDERLCIYLWLKLPLDLWKPNETDLEIISSWLLEPLNSLRSELARVILQSLNCGILDGDLFMPFKTHQCIALMLMQTSLKLFNENEQGFIKNVSTLVYSQSAEQSASDWIWSILLKLRLHLLDKTEACLYKYFSNIEEHLKYIPEVDSNINLHSLVLRKNSLASFIALMTTTMGHSVPIMFEYGFELVEVLFNDGKYSPGMACLEFMTFLFLDCIDSLYKCEKFISVLSQLMAADNTYVQKAKNLISNNLPGPVLKSFESMIQNQLNCCRILGFNKFNDCIKLWLMSLSRLTLWTQEMGVLYLMDRLLQNSFFNYMSAQLVSVILEDLIEETKSPSETKSSFSSLVGWMNLKFTASSLLPKGFNGDVPWLSYFVIQLEFENNERKNHLWTELLKELHLSRDKKTDIDSSLKKVCNVLGYPVRLSSSLAIYKWAYQILNTDLSHPLIPLLWQKFFSLYFFRASGPSDSGSMGAKFFDGILNQRLLKQLNQRLMETIDKYKELIEQGEGNKEESHFWKCHALFQTYSLWLNDPKLHESHLSVHHLKPEYNSELLGLLVHGSDAPWIEFVDYGSIEQSFRKLSGNWSNTKGRLRNQNISRSTSFKTENSMRGNLSDRFNSYENPLPPPCLRKCCTKICPSINTKDLMSSHKMIEFVTPLVHKLMAYRDQFTFFVNQNLSLGFDIQDLSTKLYKKESTHRVLKESCMGTDIISNGKSVRRPCSGPAVINLTLEEWKLDEKMQRQFDQCREAFDENIQKNLEKLPSYVSVSAITIDVAIEELKKEYHLALKREGKSDSVRKLQETGVSLFYELMGNWNENVADIPPLERAFDRYVNILGKTFMENNERENDGLLQQILGNDVIEERFLRYFSPNVLTSPLDFVKHYSKTLECNDSGKLFTVLSKFDLVRFLHEMEPKFSVRSALLSAVGTGLVSFKSDEDVTKLLNEHLGVLLKYDFPEHYGEVLNFLLKASQDQAVGMSTWYTFVNSLVFDASFLLENGLPMKRLKQYFIKCASDQGIPLDVVIGTITVLASNFKNERLKVGCNGLYEKYTHCLEPMFTFFGMLSFSCVAKTLEMDTGSLSEKLTQQLWPLLSDLYSPWLVPYRGTKVSGGSGDPNKKEGAQDSGVWLPWTLNDLQSAHFCASIFAESVRFVSDTLPGFNNVLSYLWYFYVTNFAQPYVRDYISNVIDENLAVLPWETFFPSLQDVELMVQVVSQYLPLCHSFLGNIFVNVKWTELVQYCLTLGNDELIIKLHVCLLHLLVKLPLEPSLKQNDKVLLLLDAACHFQWHLIDADNYEVILNWFVTSCDPRIVLKDERLDYYKLDSAIYRLLKICAGHTTDAKRIHPITLEKRSMFVKACVKWLLSSNRRFKSKESPLFKEALCDMWRDLDLIVTETVPESQRLKEVVILFGEFYTIFSEPGLSSVVEDALCDFLLKKQSQGIIFCLLHSAGSALETPDQYGKIVEASLESYFRFFDEGNWSEVTNIFAPYKKSNVQFEKVLIDNKYYLTLYACFLRKIQVKEQRSFFKLLLADLLHALTEEKLSAASEPKLLLLMTLSLKIIESESKLNEKDGITLLIRLFTVLYGFVEDKGAGFLTAVGLKRPSFSIKYKLICLSVCGGIAKFFIRNHPDSTERLNANKIEEMLAAAESNKNYQSISQYVSYALTAIEEITTIREILDLVRDVGLKLFNTSFLK